MHAEDLAQYHVSSKSMNYREPRSVVSVGSIITTLTLTLTHIIPPFFRRTPRACPSKWLWISVPAAISYWKMVLMTIRVVTNLVTGEGQPVQEPSRPLLGVLTGVILIDSWAFLWHQFSP